MPSKSNQMVSISVLILAFSLSLPFLLVAKKIATEYSQLKDVRFQTERLMKQYHQALQNLASLQNSHQHIQSGFRSLTGTQSEAYATLQTQTRTLVSRSGGAINSVSSVRGQQENESELQPISVNIRWSGSETALGLLLEKLSEPQNLKLNTLNIQRKQGTSGLVDIRMQVSALWQNPQFTTEEKR